MTGRLFFLMLSFLLSAFTLAAQELPEEMVSAFKKGEAEQLKPYLSDKVQFIIEGKTEDPMKQDAAVDYFKSFFLKNKPVEFAVLHKSLREDTGFFVSKFVTSEKKYRMHCLFSINGGTLKINQVRIDKFIE